MRKAIAALSGAALMVALVAVGVPNASASHNGALEVEVGAPMEAAPAEGMRFYGPNTITVHNGDTVTFSFPGFAGHTATLLPTDVSAQDWIDANAKTPGQPYSFLSLDPDEGSTAVKDNFDFIGAPTDPACGGTGQPVCTFDGNDVLSSGIQGISAPTDAPPTFSVEINANPGERIWVVCLIHHHMRMKINVVSSATAATTQAEIDTATAEQVALDTDWAMASHSKMKARRTSHVGADGVRVWDAWAGLDNHWATTVAFYPPMLRINRGDRIRWRFDGLVYEDHTVSMPAPRVFGAVSFGEPVCDPDGDVGLAPDTAAGPPDPNDPQGLPTCPAGSTLEFDINNEVLTGVGDGVWRGFSDIEHSGVGGAQSPKPFMNGTDSYTVRFMRATGDKTLKYRCFIHPFMLGKIKVRS